MDFSNTTVIEDLSFSVTRGETFGFLGSNGSGKTTTLRALLGIYRATSGRLLIDGEPFSPEFSRRLGYLPEERGLYRKESVIDVMSYFGRLKGLGKAEARSWSMEYLERVEIGDKAKTRVDKLSGGQQQKVQKSVHPAKEYLARFAEGHSKKFPYVIELAATFNNLVNEILPEIGEEENIIFPYIRQVSHAYNSKAPYAGLLVRTLRKPVKNMTQSKHQSVYMNLLRMRELSNHYTPPENACPNHKVTFQKLNEIDDDLIQHLYLENSVLFPKAVSLEKELLEIG